MLKAPRRVVAEGTADKVARDHSVISLPVDLNAIAEANGIVVNGAKQLSGFSGMLARVGDQFGIMYSESIESEGFQRFSVAHELGHYFLPEHADQVLLHGNHYSHAGFASADPYEQEADLFAAALLMPEKLFRKAMNGHDADLAGVRSLGGKCKTSVTATAIRFCRFTDEAIGLVLSTDGIVDFCSFSDAMREAKVRWLTRGSAIPKNSLAYRISQDQARLRSGWDGAENIDLSDWFECADSHAVLEESMGLGADSDRWRPLKRDEGAPR